MNPASAKALPQHLRRDFLEVLKTRFESHMRRHVDLAWTQVQARLEANDGKLWSLHEMERTGGEPDVVGQDRVTGELIFVDCSEQAPKGRTSVCYDREALDSRKVAKPCHNALDMAAEMGVQILTEEEYRELQRLGEFDTKTSSWVRTPESVRSLGGAIFCDRRFGRVFTYHNGPQSYFAARAFRGSLRI
jgi:hypothetical protein